MKYIQEKLKMITEETAGKIPADGVFLDIETTGFSPERGSIYLIGCCHREEEGLLFSQWFAESPAEEGEILAAAARHLSSHSRLITFNGEAFDLPFLRRRAEILGVEGSAFSGKSSLDLFRSIRPLKKQLSLPDCRQKTLEAFLGLAREDRFSGGDLISVYQNYVTEPTPEAEALLLLHNREDVLALPRLLPLLSYARLLAGKCSVLSVMEREETEDSLAITLGTDLTFPRPILLYQEGVRLFLQRDRIRLTAPLVRGELRFFFPDYRSYWYLPEEDIAIHQSVAAYVEREHRQRATPDTACVRKEGVFLRVPARLPEEFHRFYSGRSKPPHILLSDCPEGTAFWEHYLLALFP